MLYRRLGNTGLQISTLSLGSWISFSNILNDKSIIEIMSYAYHHGINLFDSAEIYGAGKSEAAIGQALTKLKWLRENYIICTKVFWGGPAPTAYGLSRKHVLEGCNASLKRLNLEYIDILLCHRPDSYVPIEETVWIMNNLIQQGKILYWGTSEWPLHLIYEACWVAEKNHLIPPSIEQFEYNMFERNRAEQDEFTDSIKKTKLGIMATMPLAGGILSGKYKDERSNVQRLNLSSHSYFQDFADSDIGKIRIDKTEQLKEIAAYMNVTLPQLALAWCLQNQQMSTVILGCSNINHLKENLESLNVNINCEITQKIETILKNQPQKAYTPTYAEVLSES